MNSKNGQTDPSKDEIELLRQALRDQEAEIAELRARLSGTCEVVGLQAKAVHLECPDRTVSGTCRCQPKCAVCGWGEHMAVHMPPHGAPEDSEPYDHKFVPMEPKHGN